MTVEVTTQDPGKDWPSGPQASDAPRRPGVLGDIAKRRDQILDQQVWSVDVPRWRDPRIRMRFRPVEHDAMSKIAATAQKFRKSDPGKRSSVELNLNADALIEALVEVVAVYGEEGEEQEIGLGPDGARGGFDMDAAIALGMPENVGARAVCRAFFITDADLLGVARRLCEWSGYTNEAAEDELEGE